MILLLDPGELQGSDFIFLQDNNNIKLLYENHSKVLSNKCPTSDRSCEVSIA